MIKNRIVQLMILGISFFSTEFVLAQGAEELLLFSRQNFGISSARSSGMGGAYTSLGADISAMSINPAGVAMYAKSEVSLSSGFRVSNQTADYTGTMGNSAGEKMNQTKINIGSFGLVHASSNFAVGVGMNRLADFNGRSNAIGYGEGFSIGDMFAEQLYGASQESLSAPGGSYQAFRNYPPAKWGAIMGYQAFLVEPVENSDPKAYTMRGMIQDGTILYPEWSRSTSGAINEYTFSGGYSYEDLLYVGATVGVQDIYYSRSDNYFEYTSQGNIGLESLFYNQNLRMSGVGVNVKVGATVRPLPWLRIGVAYHSPTWMNIEEEYDADMTVWDTRYTGAYDYGYSDTPILMNEYNMRTPSRLLTGVSATIGNVGIISVDYERAWYQNMKYSTEGFKDVNEGIESTYAPSNIVRVGAEFQPIRNLFLRAGYGYSSSVYKNSALKEWGKYQQFSGGIGFRNRVVNIDLAYVYGKTRQMPFKPFSYTASDGYTVETNGAIYTKEQNHNIILTLGFKLW